MEGPSPCSPFSFFLPLFSLGWDDATIEYFLQEISQMDSNNYIGSVGTGERLASFSFFFFFFFFFLIYFLDKERGALFLILSHAAIFVFVMELGGVVILLRFNQR